MTTLTSTNDRLLSIGEFSRFAALSVRMLRHYDERGVLTPAEVDAATGYRRYAPAQLAVAGRIRSLRDAGCGVEFIAELLPLYDGATDDLRRRLYEHIAKLDAASETIASQQRRARSLADEARIAPLIVAERLIPPTRVLSLRRNVASYPAEGELWSDLRSLLSAPTDIDPAAFGEMVGATYYDAEYRDDDVEMSIWREYAGEFAPRDGFEIAELPAQRVAWTTHHGPFDTIARAREALGSWIAANGREQTGPLFALYVVGPGRESDPANWVTEVNAPVA